MDFVLELKRIQKDNRLNNAQMAKLLGYSCEQAWVRAYHNRKIDIRKIPFFIRSFPEEKGLADKFLSEIVNQINNTKEKNQWQQ